MVDRPVRGRPAYWAGTAFVTAILLLGVVSFSGVGSASPVVPAAPPPLAISSFSLNRSSVPLGGSFSGAVSATGGAPPYTYSWGGLPSPCAPANVSSWQCTASQTGSFTVTINVTDTNHSYVVGSQPLTVTAPALSITNMMVSPNSISVGSQFSASVQVSGGVPPYTYVWTGQPSSCVVGNVSSWQCSPSQTGGFTISVSVTDPDGDHTSQSQSLSVVSNGNDGNGNNHSSSNGNGNGSGLNISGLGSLEFYALIAGVVVLALLVALVVGVLVIAVTLRRLPRPPRGGIVCAVCQSPAPAGAKFCPACAAPITPPK